MVPWLKMTVVWGRVRNRQKKKEECGKLLVVCVGYSVFWPNIDTEMGKVVPRLGWERDMYWCYEYNLSGKKSCGKVTTIFTSG